MNTVRLSESQLAARLGVALGYMRRLLEECEELGLARRDGGNFWRLTEECTLRHGQNLRNLEPPDVCPSEATGRRAA